ncbi:MAG: BsaWI family type II restriction enzyme [Methanoregula sp.]
MAEILTGENNNSIAQGLRSKKGYDFETEISDYLASELGNEPLIRLLRPRTKVYLPGSKRNYDFSCMQITTSFGDVIGDTDIVVYQQKRATPLMLISCKTSLRERLASSLYNLHLYRRKYPDIKLFFVTNDNDLELGSPEKPNKNRILVLSEGVYCYSKNPKTKFGPSVYPFENMIIDIRRMAGIAQKKNTNRGRPKKKVEKSNIL